MTVLYAAWLGVVQGLTEFLPISSSAHLILARAVFGWDMGRFGLAFDVACHVGTLMAVIVYFRQDVTAMAAALPDVLGRASPGPGRRLRLIVIGTLPIVVVGLTWSDRIQSSLRTPTVAVAALALGSGLLLLTERLASKSRGEASLGWREALAVGVAQSVALIPGVSRSGATIAVGMWFGLRRQAAARFGFLLGIPAVLAAAVKTALELGREDLTAETAGLLVIGLVTSALVGYLVVGSFMRYLATRSLDVFAYYRLALAAGVFVWLTR